MKKLKLLIDLRPAMEGFSGIPQEVRLLFRGLASREDFEIEGMLQAYGERIAKGTKADGRSSKKLSAAKKFKTYSSVVISLAGGGHRSWFEKALVEIGEIAQGARLVASALIGIGEVKTSRFETKEFEDFSWQALFSKTLPTSDFKLVTAVNHRVCSMPWSFMHRIGLLTLKFRSEPRFVRLDTEGFDVFIGQTPYPAVTSSNTAMVIRYHDAIPVFMPHTIPNKTKHQLTHFYALMGNVRTNAYFACVSEASRQDLLKLFPEAEKRCVTIYNMLSHHYFEEDSLPTRIPEIIRSRAHPNDELNPRFKNRVERETFYGRLYEGDLKYLLVVSTIEPRKNHLRVLAAWEQLRNDLGIDLKLLIVGGMGWDTQPIIASFRSWMERGQLFMLTNVPAPDLRLLYKHALATVCPSRGEGFDFSGVEAIRSGGTTVASDIPVHREVYGDAAEFFDPYSTQDAIKALKRVISDADSARTREVLRESGRKITERYLPEAILPQWVSFLSQVTSGGPLEPEGVSDAG